MLAAIVVRRVLANFTVLYCWLIRKIIIIIRRWVPSHVFRFLAELARNKRTCDLFHHIYRHYMTFFEQSNFPFAGWTTATCKTGRLIEFGACKSDV